MGIMSDEIEPHDPETGELFDKDGFEKATKETAHPPKSTNFLEALENALMALPVWIKQDAEVNITANQKRKYASLKTILVTVRPILLGQHIRIKQGANPSWTMDSGAAKGKLVPIYTDLIYSPTGEIDRTIVEIPITKLDAQGMGSALSYGRRYSLLAALGLATDESEDDGASTKARNIMDEHEDSQNLWIFKSEIDSFTDLGKLLEWGQKLAATKRADTLSEPEAAMLRQHFVVAQKKIGVKVEKPARSA